VVRFQPACPRVKVETYFQSHSEAIVAFCVQGSVETTRFDITSTVNRRTPLEQEEMRAHLDLENKKELLERKCRQKHSTKSRAQRDASNYASRYGDDNTTFSTSRHMIYQETPHLEQTTSHLRAALNEQSTKSKLQPSIRDSMKTEDCTYPDAGSIELPHSSSTSLLPDRNAQLTIVLNYEEEMRMAESSFQSTPQMDGSIP
jgi:hypothetical protein